MFGSDIIRIKVKGYLRNITDNEIFEFEIANSNELGMDDIKTIITIIDEKMNEFGYLRIQLGLIDDKEINDIRRLVKYEKLIIK